MNNLVFNNPPPIDHEQTADNENLKGANPRRRSVLGRGLGALMSPSLVSIEPAPAASASQQSGPQAAVVRPGSQPSTAPFGRSTESAAASAAPPAREQQPKEEVEGVLLYLPIEQVFPNPTQPRKDFKPEDIESLSQSIRETGMLQPILVRKRKLDRAGLASSGLP